VPLRARWRSPGSYRSAASRDRRCGASEQHQQTEYPDSARPHPNSLTSTFSPTPAWWRPDARSIPASAIYLQGIDSSEIISTVHGRPSLTISANSRTPVEALGARTIGRTDICRPTRWAHPRLAIRRSKVAFVDRPALAPSARRCSRGVYSDSLERGATGLTAAGSEFSQKMQQSRAADETPSGRPYGEPAAIEIDAPALPLRCEGEVHTGRGAGAAAIHLLAVGRGDRSAGNRDNPALAATAPNFPSRGRAQLRLTVTGSAARSHRRGRSGRREAVRRLASCALAVRSRWLRGSWRRAGDDNVRPVSVRAPAIRKLRPVMGQG
jgi:hypothetical protein